MMRKYAYMVLRAGNGGIIADNIQSQLNELGEQGWRVISAVGNDHRFVWTLERVGGDEGMGLR